MKTIKYNFCGFSMPNYKDNIYKFFLKPLENKYKFVLSNNPDYVFCSRIVNVFDYAKYDCIRILYNGENTQPDFHNFDYVISFDYDLHYKDRFLYFYHCVNFLESLQFHQYSLSEAKELLDNKKYFCALSNSHDRLDGARKHYLDLLDSYKKVSVIGNLFYRGDAPLITDWNDKMDFYKKTKFTLIIEASVFSGGLITEKIFHAIQGGTIPIYLGEKDIKNVVNPKRILNINDFKNDDELLQKIIEIDNNDELYIQMLSEKPLFNPNLLVEMKENLVNFLGNIFSQEYEDAKRRPAIEYPRNIVMAKAPLVAKSYFDNQKNIINRALGKILIKLNKKI